MYQIKLEQFQGPLDLLLQLIEGEKLDISQVALAQVTDQYLTYLDAVKNISATELADFLVVATKLLVIKSKLLLPEIADNEEDSAEELELQLKIYRDYLIATKAVEQLIGRKHFSFTRERLTLAIAPSFAPPSGLTADDLSRIFGEVLGRIDYVVNLPQKVMTRTVSLQEVVTNLREQLSTLSQFNFHEMVAKAESRAEIVVCFMALLELIRQGEVAVTQKGVFDEIMVERVN